MSRLTPETFAGYLKDIESGRTSISECLEAHPAEAAELREILGLVLSIPAPPSVAPTPEYRWRTRQKLVDAISQQKNLATTHDLARYISQTWQIIFPRRIIHMPAIVIALVIALVSAGGGAAYASQDTLPGDALYQVKATLEELQLVVAGSDEVKAQVHLELAAKRLEEAQKAADKGRGDAVQASAAAATNRIADAQQNIAAAASSGKDLKEVSARLASNLERLQATLASVIDKAPPRAKPALRDAADKAAAGLQNAINRVEQNANSGTPTNAPSNTPSASGRPSDDQRSGQGQQSAQPTDTPPAARPTQAAQPATPAQPSSEPAQRATPAQPAQPTGPAQPAVVPARPTPSAGDRR